MVFLSVVIILYVYICMVRQFKRVLKRRPSAVKRQNKEVCVWIYIRSMNPQQSKDKITMKSLILAQDERYLQA